MLAAFVGAWPHEPRGQTFSVEKNVTVVAPPHKLLEKVHDEKLTQTRTQAPPHFSARGGAWVRG